MADLFFVAVVDNMFPRLSAHLLQTQTEQRPTLTSGVCCTLVADILQVVPVSRSEDFCFTNHNKNITGLLATLHHAKVGRGLLDIDLSEARPQIHLVLD